jgi:copper chaperone CopZ
MRLRWFLLAAAAPAAAQLVEVDIRYRDTGCAACVESLERRLKQMRGVEEASVDASRIRLKLAGENRVRLQQVRDFVEQGGNRIERVALKASGRAERQDGRWVLVDGRQQLPLDIGAKSEEMEEHLSQATSVQVDGEMEGFAPGAPLPPLRVRNLRSVPPLSR